MTLPLPEGCLVFDPVMVGSGYGDPLERDPELVLQDVLDRAISLKHARNIYGVVLNAAGHAIDRAATDELRKTMRADRLRSAKPVSAGRQAR